MNFDFPLNSIVRAPVRAIVEQYGDRVAITTGSGRSISSNKARELQSHDFLWSVLAAFRDKKAVSRSVLSGPGPAVRHDTRRDKTTMIPNLQLTDSAADAPEKPGTGASPNQPSGESGREHVKLSPWPHSGWFRLCSCLPVCQEIRRSFPQVASWYISPKAESSKTGATRRLVGVCHDLTRRCLQDGPLARPRGFCPKAARQHPPPWWWQRALCGGRPLRGWLARAECGAGEWFQP